MTKLDTLLYWYTLTFSVALILTALSSGFNLSNFTTMAFFLPVPAFLLLQAIKRYYLWRELQPEIPTPTVRTTSSFLPKKFLTQSNPAFIITLVLLLTAWLISLIKTL